MSINPVNANRIQSAIAFASQRTGVDFDYLMGQAKVESGLNATAKAGSSSATGLFQFIDSSWLAIVKKHGAEHGLGWAADAIGPGNRVADPATRRAILNLRNDPATASLMAASHASDNAQALSASLGRNATGTDLYMAHFLGLGGATKFLSAMQTNPGASGAALFPGAARANHGIFYAADGSARSLQDIYSRFASKLGDGADSVSETRNANLSFAAQALALDGDATVVTGANESASDALAWANSTLGRLGGKDGAQARASLLRPTPDTARLAYMMLARLGA